MKSLLSENMLRFGTKNLTATSKQELIVKSIMETIDQHGLRKTIYNRLVEQSEEPVDMTKWQADIKQQIGGVEKDLGTSAKYQGIAMKIAGLLITALSGADDEAGVLTALQMIQKNGGQRVYDTLIWVLKNNRNIKSKFGKNYNLVSTMIKDNGISKFSSDKAGYASSVTNPLSGFNAGLTDEEWTPKYQAILTKYNDDETDFS